MASRWQFGERRHEPEGGDQLDQEINLAMAFLLGVAVPKYHPPQDLVRTFKTILPSFEPWTYASSIWDSVADLQGSVDRFKAQVHALGEQGQKFPCVTGVQDKPIPIDPVVIPGFDVELLGPAFVTHLEIPKVNTHDLSIQDFAPEDAAEYFLRGLDGFLRSRLAAPRTRSAGCRKPGDPYISVQSLGLMFRVTTMTNGLRIHYTHQYYVNTRYVFGWPTTPVDALIQPGLWHFGYSQGNDPVTWDLTSVYDIPHVSQAHIPV